MCIPLEFQIGGGGGCGQYFSFEINLIFQTQREQRDVLIQKFVIF